MKYDYTTVEGIESALSELSAMMQEKGVVTPEAILSLKSDAGRGFIHIIAQYNTTPFDGRHSRAFTGATIAEKFDKARDYIAKLPSPEETVTREYLNRVSRAVDYATENSIADEYVTPLRGVTCAMTENLLTQGETE